MTSFVSRTDFQRMAEAKHADAALLLQHGRHSNAYYLGGYAVELALKAAICRQFLAECLPDKNFVADIYRHGHRLTLLVGLAGLTDDLRQAEQDPIFQANWSVVSQWSEGARYEMIDAVRAVELISAIGDPANGVLQWVRQHW